MRKEMQLMTEKERYERQMQQIIEEQEAKEKDLKEQYEKKVREAIN